MQSDLENSRDPSLGTLLHMHARLHVHVYACTCNRACSARALHARACICMHVQSCMQCTCMHNAHVPPPCQCVSLPEKCNGKVQIMHSHLLLQIFHLSSISLNLEFANLHIKCSAFPGISSPPTDITLCDVTPFTYVTQVRHTPPPS